MKLLLHVSDNDRWNPALRNAGNFLRSLENEDAQVVVVANGPAVSGYADPALQTHFKEIYATRLAHFQACRNALVMLSENPVTAIDERSLPEFVGIVPAGITALVRWQQKGFAYVKP